MCMYVCAVDVYPCSYVCPCTWICVLWACVRVHRHACCGHVSMCTVFLGHPDICMLLEESQSCPGQESMIVCMSNCVHVQLWLRLVQSHLAGKSVAQCDQRLQMTSSTSWIGPYHKLSHRICAVPAAVSFADGETEANGPGIKGCSRNV